MSWVGVPPTAVEYLPAVVDPPATVVTFTSGTGAVPENDGVSFHASEIFPSRAVVVF